jgi:hypothetical protein
MWCFAWESAQRKEPDVHIQILAIPISITLVLPIPASLYILRRDEIPD